MEHRIKVRGASLHVVDEGAGPAIVLLHAGIVDSRAWEPLVPLLARAGHRIVAPDRRGYGRSVTEDVAFSNRADVVAVLDALGIGRACLVGNSAGGQIAVDTAVEHPDRVAALVTIGASVGGFEPEPTPEEAALFDEMERLEQARDRDAEVELHLRVWVDGPGQPPARLSPTIRGWLEGLIRENADRDRVFGRPIPLEPPAATRLGVLCMPILAIAGALDVSDVPATARWLEASLPHARAVVVPDVAHLVAVERPQLVADLTVHLLQPLAPYR